MKNILLLILILLLPAQLLVSQPARAKRMFGITIDGTGSLNNIISSIGNHGRKMTTRIVFDEWVPASDYSNAVNRLDTVTQIMGEILDSYYMNAYSVKQYRDRVDEYMQVLGGKVDIWELGNEVNGEWLGSSDSVIAKITYALKKCRSYNYKNSITLYYNKNCWEQPQNEMFRWVNEKMSPKLRNNFDYVLVSYYEDDCNNLQPNWQNVFDSLHVLFPNSKLGIGECGTSIASRKEEYINRYYKMNITTPGFIGGYFWWYYRQDCVPWNSKPLWQVIENAMRSVNSDMDEPEVNDGDGY